jgi:hypothetical protein
MLREELRQEKELEQMRRQTRPAGHCSAQPYIVRSDRTLSGWRSRVNPRKMNFLRFDPSFVDMI